jgi:hypothetical protein
MPYIKPQDRYESPDISPITNPGMLNYRITMLLIRYWANSAENYQAINDIVGAVEGAKQEFYRRIAVPYENKKCRENGDVYPEV